ncbi:hypothetical protein [Endozoicomonas sp. 4G]|uniref:hypothetical protein n=1 Tax=Endozoicomonas sp. 4G TaxID=2872754 RepID=UPI002078FDA6|nr:hypothetical protein [Endozoicomonas sp. 4G]
MPSKKPLILTLVIAFSMHCSNGRAQENRLPLRFALAVGKALINARKSFIEVLSIKGIYVTGVETIFLPLFLVRDGLPDEQETEAIEWWELKVYSREASDHGSGSEGSSTSDGSSDNRSNEDEDNTESDVQYETTTLNPFRVANETSQYCTTLELKKIKEEPVSDTEILTDSEVDVTKVDAVKHQCDHEGCNYRTDHRNSLKRHKQTHLPADQRPRKYQCDYEGCNYRSDHRASLKRHKQTHLPADQRPRKYQCDYEGCNFRSDHRASLKRHKQTHLPADQRPKVHRCDHEGCNYGTNHTSNLNRHKQTHLPGDQRPERAKVHQCDHEGCDYRVERPESLKRHKKIHLPADQRPSE